MSKLNHSTASTQESLEEQYLPDFSRISSASLQKYKVTAYSTLS